MCAYDLFSDQYKNAYEKAFPIISTKRKNNSSFNQPWMTKGLLKSTKKASLYLRYVKILHWAINTNSQCIEINLKL